MRVGLYRRDGQKMEGCVCVCVCARARTCIYACLCVWEFEAGEIIEKGAVKRQIWCV